MNILITNDDGIYAYVKIKNEYVYHICGFIYY